MAVTDVGSSTANPLASTAGQLPPSEQQAIAQLMAAQGSSAAGGTGQVYLGTMSQFYATGPNGMPWSQQQEIGGPTNGAQAPLWTSIEQAKQLFGSLNTKQVNDWVAQGVLAGQLAPGSGWAQGQDLWDRMVEVAARQGANGNQVSPFDVLKTYISNQSGAGVWAKDKNGMFETNSLTGARRYIGPEFRTFNTSQVNLTDPTQAAAISTAVFQQLLGRDPLPGELNQYATALRAAEQANPTTISQTNQYDSMGNVIAVTKADQKGGYNLYAQRYLAEQQAKSNPEYGATQAATTYENAFENAVFGQAR